MRKNIVIAILMVIVAGLSILLYRAPRISKTNISKMYEAIEKQNQICHDLGSQVRWLRRHLEKTISTLEAEHNLEPMPVKSPGQNFELREELKIHRPPRPPEPFVIPYQKPEYSLFNMDPNDFGNELEPLKLAARINLSSGCALFANPYMENHLDNFYQRLQRLEPEIDKN